jgi:hypothetical protein
MLCIVFFVMTFLSFQRGATGTGLEMHAAAGSWLQLWRAGGSCRKLAAASGS